MLLGSQSTADSIEVEPQKQSLWSSKWAQKIVTSIKVFNLTVIVTSFFLHILDAEILFVINILSLNVQLATIL